MQGRPCTFAQTDSLHFVVNCHLRTPARARCANLWYIFSLITTNVIIIQDLLAPPLDGCRDHGKMNGSGLHRHRPVALGMALPGTLAAPEVDGGASSRITSPQYCWTGQLSHCRSTWTKQN